MFVIEMIMSITFYYVIDVTINFAILNAVDLMIGYLRMNGFASNAKMILMLETE